MSAGKVQLSPPDVLPEGYRLRYHFFFRVEVAGRLRWLEEVPVVQRFMGSGPAMACWDSHWHDVGFLEEFRAAGAWDGEA
jgi:hypothetical protein